MRASSRLLLALAAPFAGGTWAFAVRDRGRTVGLGNETYFVPGEAEITIKAPGAFGLSSEDDGVQLIALTHVVMDHQEEGLEQQQSLESHLATFDEVDDVWSDSFAEYILVSGSAAHSQPPKNQQLTSTNLGSSTVIVLPPSSSSSCASPLAKLSTLPPGPYFAQVIAGGSIVSVYRAYRVYPDPAGAFYYGVLQHSPSAPTSSSSSSDDGGDDDDNNHWFEVLSATSPLTDGVGAASVAVPSRLYFPAPSAELPLSGVRVGVKDLYDLKGLGKSAGSRAWFQQYHYDGSNAGKQVMAGAARTTAPSIQLLLDLGAVVVGKTRTSQFANGEAPTADWVDFQAPFNARGDGYQDASSSSAGAGAAQSSYDWVDMNVGSDTGGSVRAPAAVGGVFGNRPSQDVMTLEGVLPMSRYMDTAGFMARSADEFARWGRAWYGAGNASLVLPTTTKEKQGSSFPRRLIYPVDTPGLNETLYPSPGFFPSSNGAAQELYDGFVSGLESVLGSAVQSEVLDFYEAYRAASGLYPVEQLGAVWTLMTAYEQSHGSGAFAQLSRDWAASHEGGRKPYFDPPVAANMAYGLELTEGLFEEALANKTAFKTWVETELLVRLPTEAGEEGSGSSSCSSAVLVSPIWDGTPVYRDEYPAQSPAEAGPFFGWNKYGISQLAGVPEVVLPLGEVPYQSRVTGAEEYLPVAVSLLAAAGCDLMLYDLVEVLAAEGVIPKKVGVGSRLF